MICVSFVWLVSLSAICITLALTNFSADALLGPGTQGDFEDNVRDALEYVRKNIRKESQPLFKLATQVDSYS